MRSRCIVYIDGFNLYYGALRGGRHKWLNLERYFRLLLPNDDIQQIRYFTAKVVGASAANQAAYLSALETLPLVDIVLGKFKAKQIQGMCPACPFPDPQYFSTFEEKRTDVNIALWMLNDAHHDLCDRMVLVSGDSDLVPAIAMVKEQHPEKVIIVYIPARNATRGAAVELRAIADKDRLLPLQILKASQFPTQVVDGSGRVIEKPNGW
ncbi:MAG: NYN domain-containing protein [Pirellulaceae bacterium]|nr:NYN domain-containing protein [Pirellulaceae bacterium]